MSLKTRLSVSIVGLVFVLVVTLSLFNLQRVVSLEFQDVVDRAQSSALQVQYLVMSRVGERAAARIPRPRDFEDMKKLWAEIIEQDPALALLLNQAAANTRAAIEIAIHDQTGRILNSSNPAVVGTHVQPLENFAQWGSKSLAIKLNEILSRRQDYAVPVALGIAERNEPLFTIRVVVSSVLLREAVRSQIGELALASLGVLGLAMVVAVAFSGVMLRPLARLSQTIDRIATGDPMPDPPLMAEPTEFAVVESKLNLLGQQFRGARQDAVELRANIEGLLQRLDAETRRKIEHQLDFSSRLAAINRLTGGIAHEIKNPLNAISLHFELLKTKLAQQTPEPPPEAEIEVISREIRRLDRVVKTFLDFTRPVQLKLREVDLAALARDAVALIGPECEKSKITLDLDAPSGHFLIRGDQDLLQQAILNVVYNAVEAMPNGGRLGVAVQNSGSECVLSVSDQGMGIPPEIQEKIFNLYFSTKKEGSGIGLAMTFRAVQLHGGTIDVQSEPQKGTTFRLRFPSHASE